jgi:hypothetical protein
MKTRFMFVPAVFAAIGLTGCGTHGRVPHGRVTDHFPVDMTVNGTTVAARPYRVTLGDNDAVVTWTFPSGPWLVHFRDDTPCGTHHVVQRGRTETCAITIGDLRVNTYKYYAFSGANTSGDPQIYHMMTVGSPGPGTAKLASPAPNLVCVTLTNGSPTDCKGGTSTYTPTPSRGDDIYWQPDTGWKIIQITPSAPALCDDGTKPEITSAQAYCSVSTTATLTIYNYKVLLNGQTYGPFQIQVK